MGTITRLTQEKLRGLIHYDSVSGALTWKTSGKGRRAGDIAGSRDRSGYFIVGIEGAKYRAHHLAWLYTTGILPYKIDHADGNRSRDEERVQLDETSEGEAVSCSFCSFASIWRQQPSCWDESSLCSPSRRTSVWRRHRRKLVQLPLST